MENPKATIDTILEDETGIGELKVQKLTMSRYALLELVSSPFVNSEQKFTIANLIPTFYIMTQEKERLRGFNSRNIDELVDRSMEWADELRPDITSGMIDAIAVEMGLLKTVTPEAEEDKSKKAEAR